MGMFTFFNNFTSGEISPRIYPRTDLVQRKNGAKTLLNALPTVHGGVISRPGSRFVCRTKYPDRITRLIPFKYSVEQTYVIEFGDQYMRFITQGGRLEDDHINISNATDVGVIRINAVGHGFSTNDYVAIRGVLGTYEANGDWQVTVFDADNFDLNGSTFVHPYEMAGVASKIIEIVSPYTEDQLEDVNFTPDSDLIYFVHPDVIPKVLTRISPVSFTVSDLALIGGPYNDLNPDDSHTMASSSAAIGLGRTITSNKNYFTSDMIGHYLRIGGTTGSPAVQGYVFITAVGGPTTATADVIATLSSAAATNNWALGAFGDFTGYPVAVTWFDQRLVFLGTDTQPQTGWGSATTRVLDFSVGVAASDAITFTVRTDEVNRIVWGASSDNLIIGTIGGEHKITGNDNSAITPTNIVARQQTAYGSKNVRPVKAGELVIHIQRGGNRVRQVSFSIDSDKYISNDLTLLAEHLFKDTEVVDMSFQLQPDPIIWFVMSDGTFRSCTILPDNNVAAFAQHTFQDSSVQRCLSLPQNNDTDDETYMMVARTINGQSVRYIEVFDYDLAVDCALSGTFSPAAYTIRGLEHLEGETVSINGDDTEYVQQVVSGNTIEIDDGELPISNVQIGLPFTPTIVLLSPEWELQSGPTFGRKKLFNKVLIFAVDTATLSLNGDEAPALSVDDLMDMPPSVEANGIFQFATLGNAIALNLTITQPAPLKMHITGVYGEASIGDF